MGKDKRKIKKDVIRLDDEGELQKVEWRETT